MNIEQVISVAMGEFQWLSILLIAAIVINATGIAYLVMTLKHMQSQLTNQRELIADLRNRIKLS